MPDFDTRKPQEPDEPNRFGVALLADKLRTLLIANKLRIPLIANRIRTLLIASKGRILSLADRLRSLLVANKLRTLVISGGVLVCVAAVTMGLLIYSSSGIGDQQQGGGIVSGMQSLFVEDIKVDPVLNRKIVFQLSGPYQTPPYYAISTMNANGSGLKRLTSPRDYSTSAEDPARSPDLKKIAFTRVVAETTEEESASASARAEGPSSIQVPYVFIMNADGSDEKKLLDMPAAKPDWSPDGKQIVFSSDEMWSSSGVSEDGECDLYVASADGSDIPRRLTTEPGCDSNPAWSPDGTKIAFTSDRGGNLDIYVINACCEEGDTNQSQQLTNDPPDDTDPAWSPDGTKIAFTKSVSASETVVDASGTIPQADVYKMDVDGSEKTRLTYSEAFEAQPAWSPDGKKIAFTRQDFPGAYTGSSTGETTMMPTTGIFTMDSDGSDPALVRIFQNEIASFPEWGVTAQQDEGAEQAVEGEPTEEAIADWRALDARMPDAVVQAYIEEMNELLREVNLHDSVISGEETLATHMTSSTLEGSDLSGKEEVVRFLAKAEYLPGIPINYADLRGIDLSNANLSDAQLGGNLSGANLSNANLSRSYIIYSNLSGADLSGANLSGTKLDGTDLRNADLTGANLRDADLTGADLSGARGVGDQQGTASAENQQQEAPQQERTAPRTSTEPTQHGTASAEPLSVCGDGGGQKQQVADKGSNGKIAFSGIRPSDAATTNNWEIYTVNADGSELANITNNPSIDTSPVWSPDGKKIAFMRNNDGDEDIYVMNADGTEQKKLTDSSGDDSAPAWSPNGKKIAFMSNRAGSLDIFIMDSDGGNVTRLTNNARYNANPSWSPDGTMVAFQSTPPSGAIESNEIHTISVDGTGEKALTNNQTADIHPDWSPDGRRIVFQSSTGIDVMNADGTEQSQVQSGGTSPAWSPDGMKITLVTDDEIAAINPDGSCQTFITRTPDLAVIDPDW